MQKKKKGKKKKISSHCLSSLALSRSLLVSPFFIALSIKRGRLFRCLPYSFFLISTSPRAPRAREHLGACRGGREQKSERGLSILRRRRRRFLWGPDRAIIQKPKKVYPLSKNSRMSSAELSEVSRRMDEIVAQAAAQGALDEQFTQLRELEVREERGDCWLGDAKTVG